MTQEANTSHDSQQHHILGQPSWRLANDQVEAFVTQQGGHLAPITFDRTQRRIQPMSVAPWAEESIPDNSPPIIKSLRGDFFCLPFGLNLPSDKNDNHPIHGETANEAWQFQSTKKNGVRTTLHTSLECTICPARVDKMISVVDGHNAVYSEHIVHGLEGDMPVGHHAMLKFPPNAHSGRISTSRYLHAQSLPQPMELPENKGYSCLQPNQKIESLDSAMMITGEPTDLTRYPSRRGYEDLFVLVSDPSLPFGWSAVTFHQEGYVWFSLKNPRLLRQTNFWISNGGRHYEPWNGRHVDVMGIEEVTGYFHNGLYESTQPNDFTRMGYSTALSFQRDTPTRIPYIMAIAMIPPEFDCVADIKAVDDGQAVQLTAVSGCVVRVPLQVDFLNENDS